MRNKKLARRYAAALGELAHEQDLLDRVEDELQAVRQVLLDQASFRRVIENREIKEAEKARLLRETFKERFSKVTMNFLLLVVSRHREAYLDQMIDEFVAYANNKRGIVEVEVTTAAPLSSDQSDSIAQRLSQVTGKRVRLMTNEDEELLGGIVARIGDLVMDGSVKTRLGLLKETLKRAQLN